MHANKPRRARRRLRVFLPLLLILSACGPSISEPASTQTAAAVYTAAVGTFSAQAVTPLPLTPPPVVPSSSAPPEGPSTSPSAAAGAISSGACDASAFVADVTVPDGAPIAAGAKFTKTWMLQNTGSCTWSTAYRLSFYSGDQMAGSDVSLQSTVAPGQQVAVSVDLVAPTAPGTYKGVWRMHNADGQAFGDVPYVVITVGAVAATSTCHASSRTQVTISGHAGPEKVTIDYGDGQVFTDPDGNYTFTVPMGWSGTVTPSKAKVHPWTFNPEHRTYTNLRCDLNHEDYKATPPPGV